MKLPKIALPKIKLPKIKLPSFSKKDEDDDDDFDDFDDFDPADYEPDETADDAAADAGAGDGAPDGDGGAMAESPSEAPMEGAEEPPAEQKTADEVMAEQAGLQGGAGDDDLNADLEGMPTPSSNDDFDGDFDDDFDDDDEDGGRKNPFANMDKRKMALVAVAVLGTMGIIGGGAWFLIGGSDDEETASIASTEETAALTPPGQDGEGLGEGEEAAASSDFDPNSLNALGAKDAKGPDEGIVVPASTKTAYAGLPMPQGVSGLAPAPDQALTEPSAQGLLPKVGADGRQSWQVYARPLDTNTPADVPRIAVVIKGLGLSEAATEAAITLMPPVITLAFDPYAKGLQHWGAQAREHGHETLMSVPLESGLFPVIDPGTKALMTALKKEENAVTLNGMLGSMSGYVGILTTHGTKFNQSEHHVTNLLQNLKTRGLMVVEASPVAKSEMPKASAKLEVPRAKADLLSPDDVSPAGVAAYLAQAEALARKRSAVVITLEPYPSVLRALPAWLASLPAKKLAAVPVTAVANKQFLE